MLPVKLNFVSDQNGVETARIRYNWTIITVQYDNDFSVKLDAIKQIINKRKTKFESIRGDKNNLNNNDESKSFNKFMIDATKNFSLQQIFLSWYIQK